jgi:peptide/nickel transport system substrate-binding protein
MSVIRPVSKAVVMAAALLLSPVLAAQELKIGLSTEPSALDPQYHNLGPNNQIAQHFFDVLIAQDPDQNLIPGLAVAWHPVGNDVWELKLRPNVKFHDGSPFTAEDVVFTIDRVAKVPNSPSPFTIVTRQIDKVEVVDPMTVRLKTRGPAPLLPNDLGSLPIMSRIAAAGDAPEGKTTAQINSGQGLVGTGPFKFVEWQRGSQLVMERNDAYWGEKPHWQKVTFKPLSNHAARVAALLSGDVDFIENPPTADIVRLEKDPKLAVVKKQSNRVIYIAFDQFAEPTPGVPDAGGRNPFKDRRVRKALSMALDRPSIVERIMEGQAAPAGELLPSPMFGTRPDAPVEKYDVEGAKKLLAEAGYGNGFSVTLGTPNGRYVNDLKLAQIVAAMWSRAGVKTEVDQASPPVFFKNRDEYKYSAYLAGWGAGTGEMSSPLRALVATPDRGKGLGGTNKGRYSNSNMDAKLVEALATVDDAKRKALLQEASRLVMEDVGIVPLHFELSSWALKRGLTYPGRADQNTFAHQVKPSATR